MKLLGVTRLLSSNFWVGSTPAQSLQGRAWPATWSFAWNLSPLQFLMLPGLVIPFCKGFDKAKKTLGAKFGFRAYVLSCGCQGGVQVGGGNFYENFAILYKTDPTWKWIWRDACILGDIVSVGEGAEFALIVGCILFGMHFSQSKKSLLHNLYCTSRGIKCMPCKKSTQSSAKWRSKIFYGRWPTLVSI